ncbi:BAP31 protein, partial [Thalassarche chlororhynchos]|nr:BAP31 protein [Thalassarche chlororhynchos]
MSPQWTAVATFLYAKVFLILLLCIPFILATRWDGGGPGKIFKLRLVGLAVAYGNTIFVILIAILVLLLFGGCWDNPPRGFGLGCPGPPFADALLLRCLVTIILQQAMLGASTEAFWKQAEGASQATRQVL